ncbi:septum formation inhibitor Maf [Methylomonas paludis]|uniref:7-methyl-GTP pyrophosphatase n=1 Tax=Methylomonas paludis TaxID=1173101 RepID=A0A975MLX7_9GAMM|nr:nucleoside triphosphate pyrophosphatase [Methylomonas paludis]QWF70240.1 septum formation inhibitor Maf [Methylomonas paludis]
MSTLVLASGSAYRAELLAKLQLDFISFNSEVDESPQPGENPAQLAIRLAQAKARAVGVMFPHGLIIGSDQVALCGTQLLGKPGQRQPAIAQLQAQSGQCVEFYTAVSVFDASRNRCLTDLDITRVYFRQLSLEQIEHYVDLEQPYACAGSFKAEGLGIALFSGIESSDPSALIGLPLIKLVSLLARFGVTVL